MTAVLFLLFHLFLCKGAELIFENCSSQLHDKDAVQRSVTKANVLLQRHPTLYPREDRLAIMILFSNGLSEQSNSERIRYLRCSLKKLRAYLMPTTPLDIFVWVRTKHGEALVVPEWIESIPRVNVMKVEPSTWQVPCGLKSDKEWTMRYRFDYDYYLMGRWRLTFSFDFVKAMGYAYHMQFDDDSVLNGPVAYNVVNALRQGGSYMAAFFPPVDEIPEVVHGLPELTKYWLVVNSYTPQGALYQHVTPHDQSGLTSEGWDRMYYRGYGLVTSVEYWFHPQVQDYLTTVMRLGRDIEGRWQEQAVMNMMRLVFIPEEKFKQLPGVDIGHNREDKMNYVNWCVRAGFE
jgi:hypothetical protein